MNRVVNIQQPEPGLYVVTFHRSGAEPVGKLLQTIANPPMELADWPIQNSTIASVPDMLHTSLDAMYRGEHEQRKR